MYRAYPQPLLLVALKHCLYLPSHLHYFCSCAESDMCRAFWWRTWVSRSLETAPSEDPSIGLCLGPFGGPREGGRLPERGTPVHGIRRASLRRGCGLHPQPVPNALPALGRRKNSFNGRLLHWNWLKPRPESGLG